VLLHALAKNDNLSILRQLNFDDILLRFVHPAMLPSRIKDVGFAPAGPRPNPMGIVVVPFFNFLDPAQIECGWLRQLGLGNIAVRNARIAAACQAGARNQEGMEEAKEAKRCLQPFHFCKTAQLQNPPGDCRSTG